VAYDNYTAAVNWYRKAAEQGNEYAIEKLKELGEKF
jgi:TPR repeat protein